MKKQTLPLPKLVIKQKGAKPKELSTVFLPDMLPYLGIEATEKDEIKQYADWYSTVHSTEQDIFVVADGARNGLILKGKKGAVGSTLYCVTPLWIDTDFLYYYLKLNEVQRKDTRHVENTFWNIPVPIVSLEKQKQIVKDIKDALSTFEQQNKELELQLIQSLKSLVGTDSDILENIQSLDDFKMAVLNLACLGHLTKTKNKWNSFIIEDLFEVKTGFTPSRSNLENWNNGTIHWIKSGEVNNGFITNSEEKISKIALKGHNTDLLPIDTILVAMYGEGKTRGQVGLLKIEASINQAVAALVNNEMVKETKMFIYYSLLNQYHNLRGISSANARNNLNLTILKNINISLPPIDEQIKIIKLIEEILILAEKINQDYQKEQEEQQKLQKSILSSFYKDLAFDGNIEEILSTIEAERAKKNIEIFDLRKKQKRFRDSQSTLSKMKIIEILQQSNGNKLTVEDLWTKSNYSENKEVELFYEELYDLETQNKIKVSFVDDSKIHSFITLQKNED